MSLRTWWRSLKRRLRKQSLPDKRKPGAHRVRIHCAACGRSLGRPTDLCKKCHGIVRRLRFAERIGRSTRWLRKMTRIGEIKPIRKGGALLYYDDMLNENFPGTRLQVERRVRELMIVDKAPTTPRLRRAGG